MFPPITGAAAALIDQRRSCGYASAMHPPKPPCAQASARSGNRPASRLAWLLIAGGWLSTGLGVAGIFLPLLPTVPLLLLALACFARSSPRYYQWLLDHPHLGPVVSDYLDGRGIPLRAKVTAIGLIWLSISLSLLLVSAPGWLRFLLVSVAAGVTLYLLRLPTRNEDAGS